MVIRVVALGLALVSFASPLARAEQPAEAAYREAARQIVRDRHAADRAVEVGAQIGTGGMAVLLIAAGASGFTGPGIPVVLGATAIAGTAVMAGSFSIGIARTLWLDRRAGRHQQALFELAGELRASTYIREATLELQQELAWKALGTNVSRSAPTRPAPSSPRIGAAPQAGTAR